MTPEEERYYPQPLKYMNMKYITYSIDNRIARITLNRPEKRNALNGTVVEELLQVLDTAERDDKVKVIILKAEGNTFCAGADLAYLRQLQKITYEENLADSHRLKELFYRIYTLEKVVIAQVQGHAIAGGCGLATVCDFSFVVPEAKLGYTEARIGFIPAIVAVFLLRKIGEGRARELLLGGNLISAEKAVQYGMMNRVVAATELASAVEEFALSLCRDNSGESMADIKRMIARVQEMGLPDGTNYAAEMNAKARAREDCREGIAAFLNKGRVQW